MRPLSRLNFFVPLFDNLQGSFGPPFNIFPVESGAQHAVVTLRPNKRSVAQCRERGVSVEPIRLRLIRVDLPGEMEVLITHLMDDAVYDAAQFKALYHQRWGCEENYKRFNLEAAVERRTECDPLGAGQGATSEE